MFSIDGQTTIVAIASALNGGARGIVRLSGERTQEILERFFASPTTEVAEKPAEKPADQPAEKPAEKTAGESGESTGEIAGSLLDRIRVAPDRAGNYPVTIPLDDWRSIPGILYYWPNKRSYTGEPSAEIHTISSIPILNRIVERLLDAGAVPAQGGEFTFRAFLSGKLDLTQAEAVLGLIEATDEGAFKAAAAQLSGGLSNRLNQTRRRLLDALIQLEAGFDFTDEDISFISAEELKSALAESLDELVKLEARLTENTAASRLVKVVLCGNPNVGKSSLFNRLLNRSAAIVSPIQGSTRDYLTQTVSWSGLDFQIIDTAGRFSEAKRVLSSSLDSDKDSVTTAEAPGERAIDNQAQRQAIEQADQAHIRILCLSPDEPLSDWQREAIDANQISFIVYTKSDLPCCALPGRASSDAELPEAQIAPADPTPDIRPTPDTKPTLRTSCVTGEGIEALKRQIIRFAKQRKTSDSEILASTSARCRQTLTEATAALRRAFDITARPETYEEELAAEEIRRCLDQLGKIVGAVYTEDILNGVFGRFCVGK